MNSLEELRRLVPSTIIPLDLYVERNADRQLAANVRDMGRPGYVLVARQMGKTNLLIHAKRTLETDAVRFVYVDLSVAAYHDERECFRHIVDIALDSHRDIFGALEPIIAEKRKQLRPPNREHDSELRLLLAKSQRKLIIILDEIDSLVNAEFSDRVFAHIRSVYFSRINYAELSSLGYVLSGVVEPNEIIKDKKISPFNIGEKIYLDDFSPEEVRQFVTQAGLKFEQSGFERINFWTGGNPRILWDVCSQLEALAHDTAFTAETVDQIVSEYYLVNFDRAPVDHIRELVRENADVRSSVWSLVEDRPEEISDAARTKLYLFGVIRASSTNDLPTIKNEIIARALSLDWLRGLATDQRAVFNQAQEQYDRKRYDRALQGFRDYLEGACDDDSLLHFVWYMAGSCHYFLGQYGDALKCFANASTLNPPELESRRDMLMGICHLYRREYDDSISLLKQAKANALDPAIKCQIQLNLGSVLLRRKSASDLDEAEMIFTTLETELAAIPVIPREFLSRGTLETAMFYNLGMVYREKGETTQATEALTKALSVAETYAYPAIYVCLAELSSCAQNKRDYLKKAVEICIDERLQPSEPDPDRPLALSEIIIFDIVRQLVDTSMHDELAQVLDHLDREIHSALKGRFGWLLRAGKHAVAKSRKDQAAKLFRAALDVGGQTSPEKLECVSWLLWLDRSPDLESLFLELLTHEELQPSFSYVGMANIATMAIERVGASLWSEALDVVRKAARFREVVGPSLVKNFIGLDLVEMMCLENLGQRDSLPQIAKRSQALWNSLPVVKDNGLVFFSDSDFEYAREYAGKFINPSGLRLVFPKSNVRLPDIGRNQKVSVKYQDGREIRDVKFKRVEGDLRSGECTLL